MTEPRKLTSNDALDEVVKQSSQRPVFLFKHSLTCPISGTAYREYESFIEEQGEGAGAEFSLIEVQNARELSNLVAERTGVRHESPQALLFVDGEVAWHASHWSIKQAALGQALAEHA